jgi:gliding motility-associated-like protein
MRITLYQVHKQKFNPTIMSKSLLIIFALFLLRFNNYAQGWISSSVVNCSDNIEPKYSIVDDNNNVFILYAFQGILNTYSNLTSFGVRDLILEKRNSSGNLLWYKRIGCIKNDNAGGLTIDGNGNIFLLVNSYGNCHFSATDSIMNTGSMDVIMAMYSNDGTFSWAKRICAGSTLQGSVNLNYDRFNQRLITAGYYNDTLKIGSQSSDMQTLLGNGDTYTSHFIAAFDLTGIRLWSKRILGTNNLSRFVDVEESENGYYFGGYFLNNMTFDLGTISSSTTTAGSYDVFLYKTDYDGNGQWIRRIRGTKVENFRALTTDEYDNLYILGNSNSTDISIDSTQTETKIHSIPISSYDTYICKYNRSGTLQWFLRKGSTSKDIYNDFVIGKNIIYATGFFTNSITFNNDILTTVDNAPDAFLAAFNSIGDPIAGVSIKGTGAFEDAGSMVNMDASSRAYVTGYYKSLQIQIGNSTYTNDNNKNDLFFAIYKHPFNAVITDEDNVSCNGLSDGMLSVTPYFGRPPYTYSWSHDAELNNPTAQNLPAGSYTCTVTDANDSITHVTGIVSQPNPLAVNGALTNPSCYNENTGAINITVTGGNTGEYSYFWTSPDGSGIQPQIEDQTGLSHGTYTVRVKDSKDCADTTDFLLTEPAPFSYEGTSVTRIFIPPGNNGAVNLSPHGGTSPYTFSWTGPGGYTASSEDIGNLNTAGLYNLTIHDSQSCTGDTTFTVIDNFSFVAEIFDKTDVLCKGAANGTATVQVFNGTKPYSYQWSDGVTLTDSVRTGMAPGHYVVNVTDGALHTSQASVNIYEPALDLSIVLTPQNLHCNNDNSGVIDVTVTGGTMPYSYSWNNGYTGEDLVSVPAGIYSITVTDDRGCQTLDTKEITQPEAIVLTQNETSQILCHGLRTADVAIAVNGGTAPYTYVWDDPGDQSTPTAYELGAGLYHCTVTDANQCAQTEEVSVLEPDTLTVTVILNNPSCPGLEDGSIVPTPQGGTGPNYDYIWSNSVFERFNTDIPEGTYILTMNDANNCIIVDTFNLADPDTVKITLVDVTDISCPGKTDGSLTIHAIGGSGVYEFSTDNGGNYGNQSVVANLPSGDYTVLVRDDKDCVSENELATISIADTVTIDTIDIADATCNGLNDGTVTLKVTGGTGTYQYSTDGGSTFGGVSILEALAAGNYSIVVRDGNDCNSDQSLITLTNSDTVAISNIESTDLTCSGLPDGTITITGSGGSGVYQYSIDGGTTFSDQPAFTALSQAEYHVLVKDDQECLSEENNVTLNSQDACSLFLYNAFSPNDDGKNDVWNIENVASFPDIVVKIFNIWGKEVFDSKGYGTPWDGTYNGNDLPSGTYYYVIDPGDGSGILTGDVSIVK